MRRAGSQILSQVEQLPGVQAAAIVKGLPFRFVPDGGFEIEGRLLPADTHQVPDADYRMATPDFFKALGIPVLRGRSFTGADSRSTQQVVIVNHSFVKEFFPAGDVLGRRIRFLGFDRKPQFMTIVGVIPDVRVSFNDPPRAEVYAELFQHADAMMDADLVTLLGVFAGAALLLAVVGVYGLLSYGVTRRTSEIGVRMALGASGGRIMQLVLSEGGKLVAVGSAIGLIGSLAATRALKALLQQVKVNDPAALLIAVGAFAVAALVAFYLPAKRAADVDPAEALRAE